MRTNNGMRCRGALLAAALWAAADAGAFDGAGTGSKADPFRISTLAELQEMKNGLEAHYALVNDIDASATAQWNDGQGFCPVGDRAHPFAGTFDGQGYAIRGLRIDRFGQVTVCLALFGATAPGAELRNVTLHNAWVKGCDCVGLLVGVNAGLISRCHVSGSVFGSGTFGGLAGGNAGGRIEQCSAAVEVGPEWVGNHAGGLIGSCNDGWIVNCYATGNVRGAENPGGLVGVNSGGSIKNCYASGNVESTFGGASDKYRRGAGGLVAANQRDGKIINCFATGTVKAPAATPAGGLAGINDSGACIRGSYCRCPPSASGVGKVYPESGAVECEPLADIETSLAGNAESLLKGWDFKDLWALPVAADGARPRFKTQFGANYKPPFGAGSSPAFELADVRNMTNAVLQLTCTLVDGSRLIGEPGIASLPVQTAYARVELALKHVRRITLEEDRELAVFEMTNGDRVKGALMLKALELSTVFGKVKVGAEQIVRVDVRIWDRPGPGRTTGGTVITHGGYRIHTFTNNGIFTVSGGPLNCEVLVVAGGGGSGYGGGGGGGGVIHTNLLIRGSAQVIIGAGGRGQDDDVGVAGANGGDSVFDALVAFGGGGGGAGYGNAGRDGGSGGGAGFANAVAGGGRAGRGMPGQGRDGGRSETNHPGSGAGGGGGAGAPGGTGWNSGQGGAGGDGLPCAIDGVLKYYGGGGGGSGQAGTGGPQDGGRGGLGGGGNGKGTILAAEHGAPNTGGGAGGPQAKTRSRAGAKDGGSGIVIIRYPCYPSQGGELP